MTEGELWRAALEAGMRPPEPPATRGAYNSIDVVSEPSDGKPGLIVVHRSGPPKDIHKAPTTLKEMRREYEADKWESIDERRKRKAAADKKKKAARKKGRR